MSSSPKNHQPSTLPEQTQYLVFHASSMPENSPFGYPPYANDEVSLQVIFIVVSLPFYSNHKDLLSCTGYSAGDHTHRFAAHAVIVPCESYRWYAHLVGGGPATDHGQHQQSLFCQSGPGGPRCGGRVHLHMIAFSNYRVTCREPFLPSEP